MLRKNWVHFLFIGVVCFFAFFVNNRAVYVDIMESRNLVTAREMVTYNNWLLPTMNGELRMEKPPLPTWVAALIEKVSPDNIGMQRAAAGLMGTIMVFCLYFLVAALTRNRLMALLSSLVLATCLNVVLMGRVATWDIYCHSFMLLAIFFFYRATSAKRTRWWDFVLSGLFMGLSFLGKGPVSFYALLLPFLISYLVIYQPSYRHKWWPTLLMIVIFCVVSFWWPVYLYFSHADAAVGALVQESTAWLERNVRPWYYYWQFFAESGIWSLFLLTALLGWFILRKKVVFKREYTFTVLWTLLTLVLLSLFPEKKIRYLLPLLIPASVVVAHYIFYVFTASRHNMLTKTDKIVFRINALIPAIVALVIPVAAYILFYSRQQMSLMLFVILSLLFLVASFSIFVGGIKLKPLKVFTGIVVLMIVTETLLMPRAANLFNNTEVKSLRAVREIEALQDMPFYHPQDEELRIELVYEAGRRILPLNLSDTACLNITPFVLVSGQSPEALFSDEFRESLNLRLVDVYDNNARPKESRRYSSKFIRYVTIVDKK